MGRLKKKDKEEAHKGIDDTKELLDKVKSENGLDIAEIFDIVKASVDAEEEEPQHVPIHALEEIRAKLGEKIPVKDEEGNEVLQPVYSEEEKVKVIFGLLSEKGLNLLDFLEKVLAETGYNGKVLFSINETMSKTTEVLRDIAEMQYRKAKLENERVHLEIQKYKADLKKREIEIKERAVDQGPGDTNVIAVGNPAELLEIMRGKKGLDDIKTAEIVDEPEEKEEGEDA